MLGCVSDGCPYGVCSVTKIQRQPIVASSVIAVVLIFATHRHPQLEPGSRLEKTFGAVRGSGEEQENARH